MEDFEERASLAKLGDDDRVPLVGRGTHEHHQVRVTHVHECLDLSLELLAQLAVLNQAMNFQLFDGDIGELVLGLVHVGGGALTNLRQIRQVHQVDLLRRPVPENEINELYR